MIWLLFITWIFGMFPVTLAVYDEPEKFPEYTPVMVVVVIFWPIFVLCKALYRFILW